MFAPAPLLWVMAPVPREIVPLVSVIAPGWAKVRLPALWTPLTVTVPAVPLLPAEKLRSSLVVVVVTVGAIDPLESVLQNIAEPIVPVETPEPAVVPLVSQ